MYLFLSLCISLCRYFNNLLISAEQEAIQTMKLAEMERYVSTRLQRTRDMTQQLAFHISACQAIADTVGSEFQVLQTIEKLMLDCKDRKECLSYIERNIGAFSETLELIKLELYLIAIEIRIKMISLWLKCKILFLQMSMSCDVCVSSACCLSLPTVSRKTRF